TLAISNPVRIHPGTEQARVVVPKTIKSLGERHFRRGEQHESTSLLEDGLVDAQVRITLVVQARNQDGPLGYSQDAAIRRGKHVGKIDKNIFLLVLLNKT